MLKMNQKKGASLCFDQIKNKKVASFVFWEIKNKNLPASSVFQKSGLRNICLFFFSLNYVNLPVKSPLKFWSKMAFFLIIKSWYFPVKAYRALHLHV